nr:unnamed protein product [Callosobruchus chinensis]
MSEVTGISRTSIQRILKHYKWHPYKIQLLHELNEDDHDRHLTVLKHNGFAIDVIGEAWKKLALAPILPQILAEYHLRILGSQNTFLQTQNGSTPDTAKRTLK